MSNRWFLDTEFHEDGRIIDLISIALVSESGGYEYYACLSDGWEESKCNDFVREKVLPKLPSRDSAAWRSRAQVKFDIIEIVGPNIESRKPEFWGYFADYDWVALCQLYGRMVDLPKGFPFYCHDLKQEMSLAGISKESLPVDLQVQFGEHSALADARWNRDLYKHLRG